MQHTYFVPRNTTKLTTRGGTSPDGMEMTLIREWKSTHRLGTRLIGDIYQPYVGYTLFFFCGPFVFPVLILLLIPFCLEAAL